MSKKQWSADAIAIAVQAELVESRFRVRIFNFWFRQKFYKWISYFLVYNDLAEGLFAQLSHILLIFIKLSLLSLFFSLALDLLSTTNLQYTQRGPIQRSGSPKLARRSLGDREIWVVLYVYCKVVVESRSRRAKKQREQRQFDEHKQKHG